MTRSWPGATALVALMLAAFGGSRGAAATGSEARLATGPDGGASPTWTPMAPGAEQAMLPTGESASPVRLFRFDLRRFAADVVVGEGSPPRPRTAAEVVHQRHAVAAVNGGFFDEHVAPLGLRIATAKTRSALRRKSDWGVLLLFPSRARIVHTKDFQPEPGIVGAIQVGPRLVVDGAPLRLLPQTARRTAVALDREGGKLTLVVADDPIEANQLAALLARAGFFSALLLDGGPSTQLAVDVGATHVDTPGGYPVPDLLAILPGTGLPPTDTPEPGGGRSGWRARLPGSHQGSVTRP